jgi:hypothetical protein
LRRWIAWSKSGAFTITKTGSFVKISHCIAARSYIDLQSHPWFGTQVFLTECTHLNGSIRLSQDTILTHCTSTPYSSHVDLPREQHHTQDEYNLLEKEWRGAPGRIVILRWLGLNRFFPPEETKYRSIQRGCLSVSCVAR